ncbi:unnamed protein product, partial [Amoebophrya sp. A25]
GRSAGFVTASGSDLDQRCSRKSTRLRGAQGQATRSPQKCVTATGDKIGSKGGHIHVGDG